MKLSSLKPTSAALAAVLLILASLSVAAQNSGSNLISGDFSLDRTASEDPSTIVDTVATRQALTPVQKRSLAAKLESSQSLSISTQGNQVSIITASGAAPAVFTADGVARSGRGRDGSSMSVTARFDGDALTISSIGSNSDYTVVFAPMDGGRTIRVTKRVTTPYLSETIFVDSVYRRIGSGPDTSAAVPASSYPSSGSVSDGNSVPSDDDAGWSDSGSSGGVIYNPNPSADRGTSGSPSISNRPSYRRTPRTGNFAVASGTVLTGSLNSLVSTDVSQEGDPFRLTVESPAEYRGAVIEGHLSGVERSGKVTGRANITFNFESIVLPDGRRFDFAGVLQNITDENGREVGVNEEGEARSSSRTAKTAKRSGIGAGIGAIIGGILGGGKGALIGATIGAGAGAGSMIPGGRDDLEIGPGSRITVQSTGPGGK